MTLSSPLKTDLKLPRSQSRIHYIDPEVCGACQVQIQPKNTDNISQALLETAWQRLGHFWTLCALARERELPRPRWDLHTEEPLHNFCSACAEEALKRSGLIRS